MPDSLPISGLHCTGHRNNEVPAIFHAYGLLMVVLDRGNGVDHLDSWSTLEGSAVRDLVAGDDFCVVGAERGARFSALMSAALGRPAVFRGGWARGLDDGIFELVAWME